MTFGNSKYDNFGFKNFWQVIFFSYFHNFTVIRTKQKGFWYRPLNSALKPPISQVERTNFGHFAICLGSYICLHHF